MEMASTTAPLPLHGLRDRYIERRHRKVQAWLVKDVMVKSGDTEHIVRLDPVSIFLIFFAVSSFILTIVLTNTPIGILSSTNDLGTIAAKYLLITGPVAMFAPLLVGSYVYDLKELGPITRPLIVRGQKFPDVALFGVLAGLLVIGGADFYVFTYGGFFPTLSFWQATTDKIVFADGGIFEEFIFRFVVFGTINRFPGVSRMLLGNPVVFFGFTNTLDSAAFVIYHTKVYANSTLALNIVGVESYVLGGTFRILKYPLWVVMSMHGIINWTAPP